MWKKYKRIKTNQQNPMSLKATAIIRYVYSFLLSVFNMKIIHLFMICLYKKLSNY